MNKRFLLCIFWAAGVAFAQVPSPLEDLAAKRGEAMNRLDAATALELKELAKDAVAKKNLSLAGVASAEALRLVPDPEAEGIPNQVKELPREVELVMEKREVKVKEITNVYLRELGKLMERYTREGNASMAMRVNEEIIKATPVQEKLGSPALARDNGKDKITISARVIQVLDGGLLLSSGAGNTCVLKNYPMQRSVLLGNTINCYATRTDEDFEYVDTQGAKKTSRLYYYSGPRFGGK